MWAGVTLTQSESDCRNQTSEKIQDICFILFERPGVCFIFSILLSGFSNTLNDKYEYLINT